MAHRINERNTGNWTLYGEPKTRRAKNPQPMTEADAELLCSVLGKVIDCMQYDPDISECGHLHPEAKFTDGGRFMLCLTRTQFEQLGEIYQMIFHNTPHPTHDRR